jgi:cellulose 1,4-beta-cellobiosidase
MYIDAAHGGWLGWCGTQRCSSGNECGGRKCMKHGVCECPPEQPQNAQKFTQVIKQIFSNVGITAEQKVRGFATNTANYQPLGYPEDSSIDHCQLNTQWNFAWNEIRYIDLLDALMKKNGIDKAWITDTGRNGKVDARISPQQCEQWCNVKGGLGIRPTSNVS